MKLSVLAAVATVGAASLLSAPAYAQALPLQQLPTVSGQHTLTDSMAVGGTTQMTEMPALPDAIMPMSAIGDDITTQARTPGNVVPAPLPAASDPLPTIQ